EAAAPADTLCALAPATTKVDAVNAMIKRSMMGLHTTRTASLARSRACRQVLVAIAMLAGVGAALLAVLARGLVGAIKAGGRSGRAHCGAGRTLASSRATRAHGGRRARA